MLAALFASDSSCIKAAMAMMVMMKKMMVMMMTLKKPFV